MVDEKLHAVSLRMAVRTFRPGFLGCFGARAESQRTRVRANHFGPIPPAGAVWIQRYTLLPFGLSLPHKKIGAKAPIFKGSIIYFGALK